MNLSDEQKRTLRMEFRRALAGSAQLLRQREALWRQSLSVQVLGFDGRLTERMSEVRCSTAPARVLIRDRNTEGWG